MTVSYTLKNNSQDVKSEGGWKLFLTGAEGEYFGEEVQLLPDQAVTRAFTFNVVPGDGPLVFAYPSVIADRGWDTDDLIWIVND